MWTWPKIQEFYVELASHPRPAWEGHRQYAKQMLVLLPQLESMSTDKGFQPSMSMINFEVMDLNEGVTVRIMRDETGVYLLQKFSLSTREEISTLKVEADDIMDTLDSLIE